MLVSLLQLCDKRCVNVVRKYDSIHTLALKEIDILALLLFICHVVDRLLLRLFCFFFVSTVLCLCFFRYFSDQLFHGQIFVIQILKENGVHHLITEFLILKASEFYKRTDIVPVFLVVFQVSIAHSGEFIRHFLGNILCHLIDESVILQCAS